MTLTHFDEAGRAAMVDVAGKPETERLAIARGRIVMAPATLALTPSIRCSAACASTRIARSAYGRKARTVARLSLTCRPNTSKGS